ncbi:MAG: hypothetical protein AB1445_05235 [Bacillota bacterium]
MLAITGALLLVIGLIVLIGAMATIGQSPGLGPPGAVPGPGPGLAPAFPMGRVLAGMGIAAAGGILIKLGFAAGILGAAGHVAEGTRSRKD